MFQLILFGDYSKANEPSPLLFCITGRTYVYNEFNRLTSFTGEDNITTTYAYDGNGLRTSKTTGSDTTKYYWDRGYISNEALNDSFTANNIIGATGIIAREENSTTKHMIKNIHGDVDALLDEDGQVIKQYEYDAYGVEKNIDPGDTNPFRYCGEYFDKESGSIYLRERYYNPTVGRLISEDPIRDGLNWYVYCSNNPIMFVDPWGLENYIFYLPEWENEALSDKQDLIDMGVPENEIILVPLNSAADLENGWNNMGFILDADGNRMTDADGNFLTYDSIDYVIINTHGDPTMLAGQEPGGNWWSFTTDDIAALDDKTLTKNLLIYGCNAGHLDYRYTNPAANFARKVNGASVIASDGTVSMKDANNFYNSQNDLEFQRWRNAANLTSTRDNEGWILYRTCGYQNSIINSFSIDSGSKSLIVWAGFQQFN